MSTYKLPPIAALSSSPEHIQGVLDHLFEPCPALHTLLSARLLPKSYDSYDNFIDDVSALLFKLKESSTGSEGDGKVLMDVLAAHPRLGAKKVDSAQSAAEQESLAAASKEEAQKLGGLNGKYEDTFLGLRYVVFVNGRSRSVIMEDMEARIARGDIEAEKAAAIEAMRDIAKDRASKL